ncbi:hypothetical protein [Streptomyces fradiae]|uniref:hypothetical protein n=1 Tax=Streptomyces fradiae TaxID=1906 RepID=UPI003811A2CE
MESPTAAGTEERTGRESAEETARYGAKCARLLRLYRDPEFTGVALPVHPLDPADARGFAARAHGAVPPGTSGTPGTPGTPEAPEPGEAAEPAETTAPAPRAEPAHEELVAGYAEFLRRRRPDLAARVREVCGEAPWIVRSSGAEDQEDDVNAGGYESLVCPHPGDLYATVAAVVFSGYGEHALAQQRLADPGHRPSPIAAFVQPLVDAAGAADPAAAGETPLLGEEDTARLADLLARAHRAFGMPRVDSEWVLETGAGPVSVTGLTELTPDGRLIGQLSLGFGFASAQRLGDGDNSLAWLTGVPGTTLWRGALLREVSAVRTRLVQVRPAAAFDPEPELGTLTDACRDAWRAACAAAPVDILVPPPRVRASSFLTSVRLEDAWSRYLRLDPGQRERIGHVLVERGGPAEHAAVMFRQEGVAVLRGRPEDVPETASYALADPWRRECHFGTGRPPAVETETRRTAAVPQGCRLLFASADRAADAVRAGGPLPAPEAMPGAALLDRVPHLPSRVRDRIVRDSYLPDPEVYVRTGSRVASPAFTARAAEALLDGGMPPERVAAVVPEAARAYVRGVASARASGAADVRVPVAVARLEAAGDVPGGALPAVLAAVRALAAAGGGGTEAALALLGAVASLASALRALDVYTDAEREEVLARTVAALPLDDAARTEALCRFAARSSAPPTETYRLLALAARDGDFAERYLAVERCRVDLSAADPGDAARRGRALNDAYRAYAGAGAWQAAGDAVLLDLTRSDLVEAYDSTLKRLLLELVDRPEPGPYRAYLDLLEQWLDLVGAFGLSERERRSVEGFGGWLARWREEPVPDGFALEEELTWSRLLELAAAEARAEGSADGPDTPVEGPDGPDGPDGGGEGPDNPHQLHNALHQWLLARTPRHPAERAPSGVRELQRVSDRFGPGGNKVLRFTRDAVELDVPLGIHKASLMFRPDRVEGEWTEPPDVTEADAGRLTGLSVLLERCGTWFPELVFRGERVLMAGTWTLRVEARPAAGRERFTLDGMRLALGVFRTLFDGSYDFSYVPAGDVADLPGAFREPGWAEVFRALVGYRLVYDDAELFETLETLPLGTAVGMLCTDAAIRAEVLAASTEGPEGALARLDAAWRRLADREGDPAGWIAGHNAVQQLALLVAARFPGAAVAAFTAADPPGWADVLGAALLPRADVRDDVVRALAGRPGGDLPLLRRAPWLVVTEASAADAARRVAAAPGAYRRCKQFLVHRYARLLAGEGLLAGLVADLEVVPYGAGPSGEEAVAAAVAAAGGRLRRDIRARPGAGPAPA